MRSHSRRPGRGFSSRRRVLGRWPLVAAAVALAVVGSLLTGAALGRNHTAGAATPHKYNLAMLKSPAPKQIVPAAPKAITGLHPGPRTRPTSLSEVVADRTAKSSTWKESDGSLMVRQYVMPHYYQTDKDGVWSPIDSSLSATPGQPGRWHSAANSWGVSFGPTAAAVAAEQLTVAGQSFSFTPKGPNSVTPTVSGSTATYSNVWAGVDVRERVNATSVAEDIVVNGAGSASSFAFDLAGATATPAAGGGLTLTAGGAQVATVPALTVQTATATSPLPSTTRWQSPSQSHTRKTTDATAASGARFSVAGGVVTVAVDAAWLASLPASAFPVVIDPEVDTQESPNQAVGASSFSGSVSGQMRVGYDSSGALWQGAAYFTPPSLPVPDQGTHGYQLTQAFFRASCSSSCYLGGMAVYGDPNASNTPPRYSAVGYAPVPNSVPAGTLLWAQSPSLRSTTLGDVDVTAWMTSNPSSWLGVVGHDYDSFVSPGNSIMATFAMNNIYLSEYWVEAPPPTSVLSPPDGAVIGTPTPTLTAKVVDSAPSNEVLYRFTLSSGSQGQGLVIDSGWVNQPSWTVPAGSLIDGVRYYANAFNIDNSAVNQPGTLAYVAPIYGPVTSFTLKERLGAGGPSPTDTVGSPPGGTSTPSKGAPSPGTPSSSETVNLVTGDLALSVGTHADQTLSGPAGITLAYDSLKSSVNQGWNHGLSAQYYADPNSQHVYPAAGLGQRIDPGVNLSPNGYTPVVAALQSGNNFMVRWTGTLTFPAGSWQLGGVATASGLKVLIDGSSAYDDWAGTANDLHWGSSTFDGGTSHSVEVDAWSASSSGTASLMPVLQLWANNLNVPTSQYTASGYTIVPSTWVTPVAVSLPAGWSMSSATPAWSSVLDEGTEVVVKSPGSATETFLHQSTGAYQPEPGNSDSLTLSNGTLRLTTTDGYLYTFNADGTLQSMISVADDRHPAALQYSYSGSPVALNSIIDPVSGRGMNLFYGGGSGCTSSPSVPVGMLCAIAFWDGTSTTFGYNSNGQLAMVTTPGSETTLMAYDSDNRLTSIQDALATDYITSGRSDVPSGCQSTSASACPLDTHIAFDSSNRVTSVTQPTPTIGGSAPRRSYTYSAGATQVTIAGFNPAPNGIADSVTYDNQDRITSHTSSAGLTSRTVWDNLDEPIISVDGTNEQTSTVYDAAGNVTDSYGPAPVACFDPASWPAGLPAPSAPIIGFKPVANPTTTSGCMIAVPHNQSTYDAGFNAMAETYWSNGQFAGAPALHATGFTGSYAGCTQQAPPANGSTQYTRVATALCGKWASGTAPVAVDGSGQWSVKMTGLLTWTQAAGWYDFLFNAPLPATLFMDGVPFVSNLDPNDPYNPSGVNGGGANTYWMTPGVHSFEFDMVGSNTQTISYGVLSQFDPPSTPGRNQGPFTGISATAVDPNYGLNTTSTDADGKTTTKSYSAAGIGPEDGLVTATTVDPGGLALTTTTSYEPASTGYFRRLSSTLPAGNASSYTYYGGSDGPLAAACNVNAGWSEGGQVATQTDPAPKAGDPARQQQFLYDRAGRQIGRRVGPSTSISSAGWQCIKYDARGRILSESWPTVGSAPARTVTYTYAVGGNPMVSSVSDTTSGTITSTVDFLGRLVSYTDANAQSSTVTYDQAGRVTATTGPQGNITENYDPTTSALTIVTRNGVQLATAHYDSITQRLASVIYSNNTTATMTYDGYGRQNQLKYTITSGSTLVAGDQTTTSPAGRVLTENEDINGTTLTNPGGAGATDYTYDGAGRLASAALANGKATYGYATNPTSDNCPSSTGGLNTNRTRVVFTPTTGTATTTDSCYNNADQLTSTIVGSTANTQYAYDGHGNQTTDHGTTLTWDASDRLIKTTTSSGGITTYTYDSLDRVTARTTGSTTTHYTYSGFTDSPAAVLDASNSPLQALLPLPGGPLATIKTTGAISWSYPDLHGNYTVITDTAGTRTGNPDTYDPWGQPTTGQTPLGNTTGPNTLGAFGTNGKITDTTTNITIMGARPYNPTEARFLTVDPIQGGCANPYTYAFGDPVGGSDLSGQAGCKKFDPNGSSHCGFLHLHCEVTLSVSATRSLAKWIDDNPDASPVAFVGAAIASCALAIETGPGAALCGLFAGVAAALAVDSLEHKIKDAAANGGEVRQDFYVGIPLGLTEVVPEPCPA